MSNLDGDSAKTKWKVDSAPFVPSGANNPSKMAQVASSAAYVPGGGKKDLVALAAQNAPSYAPSEDPRRASGSNPHGRSGKPGHAGVPAQGGPAVAYGAPTENPSFRRPHSAGGAYEAPASGVHHAIPQQYSQPATHQHHHPGSGPKHHHSTAHSAWTPSRPLGPLSAHATTRGPQHFFMAEQLRRELLNRTVLTLRGTDPEDAVSSGLPRVVHRYHSLYPLEDMTKDRVSQVYGVPTFVYKATDGVAFFALRRVDQVRVNEVTNPAIEGWKSIIHPHIVSLREVFTSSAFNNTNSVYVAYEYHPSAETLEQRFPACALSQNRPPGFQNDPKGLNEDILWAILIQLVSALRAVHAKGLNANKLINASKIIIVGKNRLRLSSPGLDDLLKYESRKQVVQAKQHEDIVLMGKLMLRLAAPVADASFAATQKALEDVASNYSDEFHSVLLRLLGLITRSQGTTTATEGTSLSSSREINQPQYPTLDEIQHMLATRAFAHLEKTYHFADALEGELCKELDNGRLFRLMVKLGFINERPEFDFSMPWSETGDRFPLKLFRDYVFHQVDEDGNPVMDISHVVDCLNKLDAGADERVLLMSRDERSMLVLTYKDLRRYLTESFNELVQKQSLPQLR